jgi:hypothetical protein
MFGDPITAVASTKLTDTLGYLRTQDIVLLQELGSKNAHILCYTLPTLCGTAHTSNIAEAKEWQLHYTRDSATTITHTQSMTTTS